MKNPYLRLLFISANVLIWSALILFGFRQLGNQQTYTQYKHSLLKHDNLYFYQTTADGNINQDIEIINKNDNWLPYIDIEYRGDYWHVIQVLSKKPYKSKSFGSLKDYLSTLKSKTIAVNIKNKQLFQFTKLVNEFEGYPQIKVALTSETTAVLREARNRQPKWLYLSSHSLISRVQIMGAVFLETVTQIDEDLIVLLNPNELNPRLQAEILKRKKKLLLTLSKSNTDPIPQKFFGYISTNLEALVNLSKANINK